jgi:hypothetical protein
MRETSKLVLICTFFIVNTIGAQPISDIRSEHFLSSLTMNSMPLAPEARQKIRLVNESESYTPNKKQLASGVVMITAGAILSASGYYFGEKYYSKYQKSAFTENSRDLRKKVIAFNVMAVGGGVIAGTGLLVLVLSF